MANNQQFDKRMFNIDGSEGHDSGALTPEQQLQLNQFKITTRIDNEKYLRDHPEVSYLLAGFLGNVFKQRPDNVREFAAKYFSNPSLKDEVSVKVMELKQKAAG
ncbi:RIIa domain-containing protein 1 [Exaiptasia diaphana]|uniref:RIIa domain-containing protein 1 n=1 Tax=Exaiptasia diaphana TaxID=2652724 RepID=A0A913X3Q9_EXADI|nr:RIIa domain-containing protein 1 [Exaiptasia diaphana]KXJ27218.1 RIIa domain-containing protein 1 [Exaiptasia diaphana]